MKKEVRIEIDIQYTFDRAGVIYTNLLRYFKTALCLHLVVTVRRSKYLR